MPLHSLEKDQDLWVVTGLGSLFLTVEEVTHYDRTLGIDSLLDPTFDTKYIPLQHILLTAHRPDLLHCKTGFRELT